MTFRVGQKVWKDIFGYEGRYRVSDAGEVFSILSDLVLKGSPIPRGYLTVALHKDREQKTFLIHRLVAEAFVENPDGKPSVNHLDACKTHNTATNLEWCTPIENSAHAASMGLMGVPRKLTLDDADAIRKLYFEGHRTADLALKFLVSRSTIKNVVRGVYYPMGVAS